jgi:ribosomal protein S18 acetylase RimI-like enzyme
MSKEKELGTELHIRAAGINDAEAVARCLESAFAPYREQYSPDGFADTVLSPAGVRERLLRMSLLIAMVSGQTAGTIGYSLNGSEGHLRGMAVLPEFQGKGVAEALLHAAEAELKRQGCRLVTLDTTLPLQRAIRFYEKQGYRPTERIGDFFGMPLFEFAKHL